MRYPKNLHPLAEEAIKKLGIGALAETMGIEFLELSPERSIARMPVQGNTQPLGLIHGGAYLVLAETLGSFASNAHAEPLGKYAVGIEIGATHSRSATEGWVYGVCEAIHIGRTLVTHNIAVEDEEGRRLSSIRMTNMILDRRPVGEQ